MNEEDFNFLDQNAAVQEDNLNFDPNAESGAWSGDYDSYDWSYDWSFNQPQQWQFNFEDQLSNSPLQGWQQNGTDWGMVDEQLGTNFQNPMIDVYNMMPSMNQAQNTLANIFNNKGFVTGLGVLAEGYQNKKKASALQNLVSQMRQPLDPFGSQRPFYQQQLQQAVQDPYSSPIVKAQIEQLKRAQDIKNAAAGRRSNSATTDPALLAAMAGVAQNYMNSLQTPAGANIGPQGLSSLVSAQQQGINNDVNGYLSPALSALGRSAGVDQNTKTLEALKEFLLGDK